MSSGLVLNIAANSTSAPTDTAIDIAIHGIHFTWFELRVFQSLYVDHVRGHDGIERAAQSRERMRQRLQGGGRQAPRAFQPQ